MPLMMIWIEIDEKIVVLNDKRRNYYYCYHDHHHDDEFSKKIFYYNTFSMKINQFFIFILFKKIEYLLLITLFSHLFFIEHFSFLSFHFETHTFTHFDHHYQWNENQKKMDDFFFSKKNGRLFQQKYTKYWLKKNVWRSLLITQK